MPILSNLIVRISASTTDFDKQVDRSLSKVKRFAADVTAAGSALAIGFSAPLIAAGAAAIKAGSDMESLTMGLKAVMKSSEATAAEMAKLREVAKLPGLGLEEAVKGTIRLQILGNSAEASRRIMRELGNALAVVGGGREDFNEVIRQLSQLGAVGKVTKENLDPIIERIPQLAAIIKEKFGAEALGDPAKTFERLGISSQQFIAIITDELAKGERAGNTYKNSWENIQMAAKDAAAEFGKTLLPIAQRVLDDFLTPGIEKAKAMATAFSELPKPTQDWAIAITAVATAIPFVVTASAFLIEKTTVIAGAINKAWGAAKVAFGWMKSLAGSFSMAGFAAAAAAAGVGLFLKWLMDHGEKPVDTTAEAIRQMNEELGYASQASGDLILPFGLASEAIINFGKGLPVVKKEVAKLTEEQKKAAEAAKKAAEEAYKHSFAGLAEAESTSRLQASLKSAASTWLDYTEQHVLGRKRMEETRSSLEWLTEATKKYQDTLKAGLIMNLPEAVGLPKLPTTWTAADAAREAASKSGIETEAQRSQRIAALQRNADVLREANRRGDPNVSGNMVIEAEKKLKEAIEGTSKASTASAQTQSTAARAVSLAVNDLAQNLAKSIIKWEGLGKAGRSALDSVSEFLIRSALEKQLTRIGNQILKMTQDTGALGKVLGAVFGGGSSVGNPVIKNAAGGASTAASSGGGAASAVGAASSSITGMISAVTGAVSAVSGIIGNFQFAAMNKTLDLIEKEVRYSQIHLLHTLEKANEYWPYMKACWESLVRMETRQMAVGAGGAGVVINVNGGDPKQVLDEITRTLKQYGIIPKN